MDNNFHSVRKNFVLINIVIFFVALTDPDFTSASFQGVDFNNLSNPIVYWTLGIFWFYYAYRYLQEFKIERERFRMEGIKNFYALRAKEINDELSEISDGNALLGYSPNEKHFDRIGYVIKIGEEKLKQEKKVADLKSYKRYIKKYHVFWSPELAILWLPVLIAAIAIGFSILRAIIYHC